MKRLETKQLQRETALKRRRALSADERAVKSLAICDVLKKLPALSEARVVLSYQAMPDEVDLSAYHAAAEKEEKTLAYPISLPHGIMKAAVPHGEDAFVRGAYDILTPKEESADILAPSEIDAVLIPCVAFDRQGNRLGHGAGYYDRFLAKCPAHTLRILVAFDAQALPEIVTDENDVPVHLIVTEDGVMDFRQEGG